MAKVRVYELAKEFGVESKAVMDQLKEMGEFVRSASSTIEAPVVRRLKEAFAAPAAHDQKAVQDHPRAAAQDAQAPRAKPVGRDGAAAAVGGRPAVGTAQRDGALTSRDDGVPAQRCRVPLRRPGSRRTALRARKAAPRSRRARPTGPASGLRPRLMARPPLPTAPRAAGAGSPSPASVPGRANRALPRVPGHRGPRPLPRTSAGVGQARPGPRPHGPAPRRGPPAAPGGPVSSGGQRGPVSPGGQVSQGQSGQGGPVSQGQGGQGGQVAKAARERGRPRRVHPGPVPRARCPAARRAPPRCPAARPEAG